MNGHVAFRARLIEAGKLSAQGIASEEPVAAQFELELVAAQEPRRMLPKFDVERHDFAGRQRFGPEIGVDGLQRSRAFGVELPVLSALPALGHHVAREAKRAFEPNFTARMCEGMFTRRLALLERQLGRHENLAGSTFTAADISVTYALDLGSRIGLAEAYPPRIVEYTERMRARPGYQTAISK